MSIKYLSHTADIRMLIEAKTLKELFALGVKGMNTILKEDFCHLQNKFDVKKVIETEASDTTNLLIDFLSEVLSNSYIENVIYCELHILHLTDSRIKAEALGTSIEGFDEEIKAVTYHEAHVHKNEKALWETYIIFDI